MTLGFGGASRTASGPGSFSVTLPVPIVAAPATLVLAVSAVDTAGNAARPVTIPLGVDPDVTFPSISIAAPEPGGGFIGGRPLSLVASATDDATGVSLRWRAGGGAWSAPAGGALSILVPTPAVLAETPFLLELEARDGAGNVTPASRSVRLLPNLAPILSVTAPGPGFRVTAQTSFLVTGTASDDGGLPTVTATYGGATRTSTAAAFSFSFPAPAVSTPTETTVRVVAADAEGNASPPVDLPVTVVPDAGGTPTIVLSPPAPAVLLAAEDVSVALTYADNVGLEAATAEVTGGLTSGGRLSYTLAGTSVEKVVPLATAAVPFGTPARVVATLRNISARTATLDVALPVAFHRLESSAPRGPDRRRKPPVAHVPPDAGRACARGGPEARDRDEDGGRLHCARVRPALRPAGRAGGALRRRPFRPHRPRPSLRPRRGRRERGSGGRRRRARPLRAAARHDGRHHGPHRRHRGARGGRYVQRGCARRSWT